MHNHQVAGNRVFPVFYNKDVTCLCNHCTGHSLSVECMHTHIYMKMWGFKGVKGMIQRDWQISTPSCLHAFEAEVNGY